LIGDRANKIRFLAEKILNNYSFSTSADLNTFLVILFNKCVRSGYEIIGRKQLLQDCLSLKESNNNPKIRHIYEFLVKQLQNDKNFILKLEAY